MHSAHLQSLFVMFTVEHVKLEASDKILLRSLP